MVSATRVSRGVPLAVPKNGNGAGDGHVAAEPAPVTAVSAPTRAHRSRRREWSSSSPRTTKSASSAASS